MNKNFGQNFLTDLNVKNKILNKIKINKNNTLIEIGSGYGEISKYLKNKVKEFILIEIDKNLLLKLKKKFNENKIYHDDILKINLKKIIKKKNIVIFGSLPYNITSNILEILQDLNNIKNIYIIIQKEIFNKLIDKKNKISIISNYNFKIKKLFDIKKNSFNPIPKVESSLITLEPLKKKEYLINYEKFKIIIKKLFLKNERKKFEKKFSKFIKLNKNFNKIKIKDITRLVNFIFITKND